jgi:hypothetical protein
MDIIGSSLGSAVVGVAATVLALSLLVQVLQELWKFLFSTRASCYTRVLRDFLGPWADALTRRGVMPEFLTRGPFQFSRLSPTGQLEPLATPELVEGLERVAAPWLHRALRALRLESDLQPNGAAAPSPEWKRFVSDVTSVQVGGPGTTEALDVQAFLAEHQLGSGKKAPAKVDAARALRAFRERFFQHVLDAEHHAGRLRVMFDAQYRRRNQLITFVLGFVVAFGCNQPIQRIIARAGAMTPEQVTALANNVTQMYQAASDTTATATRGLPQLDTTLTQLVAALDTLARRERDSTRVARMPLAGFEVFGTTNLGGRIWFLLGCLLTAVLVSFGAPFWNDLVGALANKNRGAPPRAPATTPPPAASEDADA